MLSGSFTARPTRPLSALNRAIAAVALLVALRGVGAQAAPLPGTPPLAIEVRDYASVPRVPLNAALARVQAIFTDAVVPVRVTLRGRLPTDDPGGEGAMVSAVTVLVYPSVRDGKITDDSRVLGAVPGAAAGGRIAYVFASRVDVLARRSGIEYGTLLGVVLAHEVGHVLLRGRPHARSGLMRPVCDVKQLRNVMLGTLAFTPEEMDLIRRAIY